MLDAAPGFVNRRRKLLTGGVLAVLAAAAATFVLLGPMASWRNVSRVPFDPAEARSALPSLASTTTATAPADTVIVIPNDQVDAFLLVGQDRRNPDEEGHSDAVQLIARPTDGSPPFIVPLPRNLALPDPCTGGTIKLKDALAGCGDEVSGPELLALLVEDFTSIRIDHYIILDFEGFAGLIDAVGGVDICVPYPVRDRTTGTGLDLPEGCTNATGEQALGWVTSRTTEAFIDGQWVALEGVSALSRDRRQRDILLQVLGKLRTMDSPSDLLAIADQIAGTFVLDEGLSITDAVAMAWDLRDINVADIVTFGIPTAPEASPDGEFLLIPTEPFLETLEANYPPAETWKVPVQP